MNTLLYKGSVLAFWATVCVIFTNDLYAQKSKNKDAKQEQIIIKKKGDKSEKTTIVIDGDNVTINGKPASEYEGKDISIDLRNDGADLNFSYDNDMSGAHVWTPGIPHPPMPPMPPIPPVAPVAPDIYFGGDAITIRGASKPMLGVYTEKDDKGARIKNVVDDSPAQKAGLLKDDIITKIDGEPVADPSSLAAIINAKKPNDNIQVTYLRNKKEKKTTIKLGERKDDFTRSFNFNTPQFNEDFTKQFRSSWGNVFNSRPRLGMRIQDTDEGNGVKVIELEDSSAAVKSGIQKDDIITNIDGTDIKNTDDAREKMQAVKDKYTYPVKIIRNGSPLIIDIKIPKQLKTTDL